MRERFQACCIEPGDPRVALLNSWSCSLVSLRLEAIADFTHGLLELEPLLRQCWSRRKCLAGSTGHRVLRAADASAGEHSTSVAVEGINAAITSPAFWTGVSLLPRRLLRSRIHRPMGRRLQLLQEPEPYLRLQRLPSCRVRVRRMAASTKTSHDQEQVSSWAILGDVT